MMEHWTYTCTSSSKIENFASVHSLQINADFLKMWCWNVSQVPNQTRHADSDTVSSSVSSSISHILSFLFCWLCVMSDFQTIHRDRIENVWASFESPFMMFLFFFQFFFDVNIIKSVYVTIKYWMSITILLLLFSLLWTVTATATTVVLVRLVFFFF